MKNAWISLMFLMVSFSAFSGQCDQKKARAAAIALFNERNPGDAVFLTEAKSGPLGSKKSSQRLKIGFFANGEGVMAEIGEIELNSTTCEIVGVKSSSALSTSFVP